MYLITLCLLLALIISVWWDNRSLLNPVLLMLTLLFAYLALARLFYNAGLTLATDLLFVAGFVVLPILLFLSSFFLIYNGIVLLRREGKSKANLLSLGMGVAILLFFVIFYLRATQPHLFASSNAWVDILFYYFFFSYFLFGFAFAGFMIYSFLYLFVPKRKHYDFIIIHGAGLLGGEKVTPLLKKRIDKAVEAFHRLDDPSVKLIASGGQGADEQVSEAQAIANYLKAETNVPQENILLEDRSRTTYENLLFSKQLGENLVENPHFLFVTNDYHVFRTSVYARNIKMKGDGLGCNTASYYIPSAFIREFVAICVRLKWIFILCYILFIALTIIAYRGILW